MKKNAEVVALKKQLKFPAFEDLMAKKIEEKENQKSYMMKLIIEKNLLVICWNYSTFNFPNAYEKSSLSNVGYMHSTYQSNGSVSKAIDLFYNVLYHYFFMSFPQ